jgi:hypothetical protein
VFLCLVSIYLRRRTGIASTAFLTQTLDGCEDSATGADRLRSTGSPRMHEGKAWKLEKEIKAWKGVEHNKGRKEKVREKKWDEEIKSGTLTKDLYAGQWLRTNAFGNLLSWGSSSRQEKCKALFTRKLDFNLRKKLVKCHIWSTAVWCWRQQFYRSQSLKSHNSEMPGPFQMRCCTGMDKISWTNRVRNEQVLHRVKVKGKAFPLQTWTGPWGSRRLRLQNF